MLGNGNCKNNNFDLKKNYFGNFVAFFPAFRTAVANAIDPMRKQTHGLYRTKQLPPPPLHPPHPHHQKKEEEEEEEEQKKQQNRKQTNNNKNKNNKKQTT